MKRSAIFGFLVAAIVAMALIVTSPAVYAKGSSGGYSGGSKSTPSPSLKATSGGYTSGYKQPAPAPAVKTSSGYSGGPKAAPAPAPAPAPAVKTSGGYSGSPKAAPAPVTVPEKVKPAAIPKDAAAAAKTTAISREQSRKAMTEYKAEQAKFKQTGSPVSASPAKQRAVMNRVVVNNYHYDSGVYAYRSRTFYSGYGWTPPVYAYGGFYPHYGLWNTMALWFMLDHINDRQYAMMYYSHRNDDDMRMWRQQVEVEARNNVELKAKLAAMDQRVQAMEQQGVQKDPGYVPPEMKEIALSESALQGAAAQQPVKKSGHSVLFWFLGIVIVGGVVYLVFFRRWKH